MRHSDRDWRDRATFDTAAAYAGGGCSTASPATMCATTLPSRKRSVYSAGGVTRNAMARKAAGGGGAARRPSSAGSSTSRMQAAQILRQCAPPSRCTSPAMHERRKSADMDVWVENNRFAAEFRRRREEIARRRRAMATRATWGGRGTGAEAMDYEALDGENQRLKQAMNTAAEGNRRYRVYCARLEEELLRSDGKMEVLLGELEQAPGMRNERLVSNARCELRKCAVVRMLLQQRRHLQEALEARNREIETLKRTQESSAIAEMAAATEEYLLETRRLKTLLSRHQLGLSSFTVSPSERCSRGDEHTSAQVADFPSEGNDGQRRMPWNDDLDLADPTWGRTPTEAVAGRWDCTRLSFNKYDQEFRQAPSHVEDRANPKEGRQGSDVYATNPMQTHRRRVRAATARVVAQEILDAEMHGDADIAPTSVRRSRPTSPFGKRSPPCAARMALRTAGGPSSARNVVSPRQRNAVPKTRLRQRPGGHHSAMDQRRSSFGNLGSKGVYPTDDIRVQNMSASRKRAAVVREPKGGGYRARPLSAPSRRCDSDIGMSSPGSKKVHTPWARSSNRTLSSWMEEDKHESCETMIPSSPPVVKGSPIISSVTIPTKSGKDVGLSGGALNGGKVVADGERPCAFPKQHADDGVALEGVKDAQASLLRSVSDVRSARGDDGTSSNSPRVRGEAVDNDRANDCSKNGGYNNEQEAGSSGRTRIRKRGRRSRTSGGDSTNQASKNRNGNDVQEVPGASSFSSTDDHSKVLDESTSSVRTEESRASMAPDESTDKVNSRGHQDKPSSSHRYNRDERFITAPRTDLQGSHRSGKEPLDATSSERGQPTLSSSSRPVGRHSVRSLSSAERGNHNDPPLTSSPPLLSKVPKSNETVASEDMRSRGSGADGESREDIIVREEDRGFEVRDELAHSQAAISAGNDGSVVERKAISHVNREMDVISVRNFGGASNADDGEMSGTDVDAGMGRNEEISSSTRAELDPRQTPSCRHRSDADEDVQKQMAFAVPSDVLRDDSKELVLPGGDEDETNSMNSQLSSSSSSSSLSCREQAFVASTDETQRRSPPTPPSLPSASEEAEGERTVAGSPQRHSTCKSSSSRRRRGDSSGSGSCGGGVDRDGDVYDPSVCETAFADEASNPPSTTGVAGSAKAPVEARARKDREAGDCYDAAQSRGVRMEPPIVEGNTDFEEGHRSDDGHGSAGDSDAGNFTSGVGRGGEESDDITSEAAGEAIVEAAKEGGEDILPVDNNEDTANEDEYGDNFAGSEDAADEYGDDFE